MILYVLVPWVGLMFAGYAFGRITERPTEARRRIYLWLGVALTALFVMLRLIGIYGDPRPWDRHTLFSFLNATKYPASLEYLCMTIGPMFVVWAFAEGWRGRLSDRDVWAGSDVLLPAAHSAHPSCRVRSLAPTRGASLTPGSSRTIRLIPDHCLPDICGACPSYTSSTLCAWCFCISHAAGMGI